MDPTRERHASRASLAHLPMRAWILLAVVVLGSGLMSCASSGLVAARAAEDLRCPEKDIKVTSREMGAYDANGCGKHMSYVVRGGEVLPDSGGDPVVGE
jgi:hypothetical protein